MTVGGTDRGSAVPAPAWSVLRDRNFWPYFAGNLFSNCGTWFQNLAQALLIYRLTGSTLLVGVVGFSQFIGTFALAPWSGAAADQFDRRRLMILTQLTSAGLTALLAAVAAAGAATTPVVIGIALLLGIATAFSVPAMQSLVPLLVPPAELAGAVALNSVTFNLARAVGPVAGAVIVAHFGIATAFALNSLSYLVLVAALLSVHPRAQSTSPRRRPRIRDSLELLAHDRRLVGLLLAVVALALTADPVTTLTPAFVTHLFHRTDTNAGVLVGAFGAGAVSAAFGVARASRGLAMRLSWTLGLLGGGIAVFALSPSFWIALPALFVGGYGFLAANAAATTAIQLEVDDAQRGRVMALWSVAFLGVRPFGSLADGAAAAAIGLRPAALMMAAPALVAALAISITLRRRRPASN